jgi:hypothetical protein
MQTTLIELNAGFRESNVANLAANRDVFAPGAPLHSALADVAADPATPEHRAFREYFRKLPGSISEVMRATIHHALSTTPPTLITFAWAPSYDYEITVWQAPDTKDTKGGITIMIKSRYPSDDHPLAAGG